MFWDDPRHPLEFFQLGGVILKSSASCLQIFKHFFKTGHKSKELSHDHKQIFVDLKLQGCKNWKIVELLHIPESTIRLIWKK